MFRVKYYYFAFALFSIISRAQNTKLIKQVDSTFKEISVKPNTIEKAEELINLFTSAAKKRYTSYPIINEAVLVSKEIYYTNGIAKAYNFIGLYKRYEQKYYESIENHKRALTYFEKTTDTLSKIKCLNSLGTTYRKVNLEKDAFKVFFEAYNYANIINHAKSKSISLNGIGNIFTDIEKYKTALYYFKKSLKLEKQNNDNRGIEYNLANIAEVHLYLKNYDSTQIYINEALKYAAKGNRIDKIGPEYSLLGLLNQKKGKYNTSTQYYKKAIELFKTSNNYRYLSNAFINIGVNYLRQKDYKKGIKLIKKGIKQAIKIGSKENVLLGEKALIDYYTTTNNYKKAFDAQSTVIAMKDSILNNASQKSIISYQIAYKSKEKDEKIKKLSDEKMKSNERADKHFKKLIYSTTLGSVILISVIIFFLLYRKNTDLKLQNANKDIQNYVLQLNKLKDSKELTSLEDRITSFDLTNRETEVLKLIAKGYHNNDISKELFISANTVKTHIKNIYIKLGVKNRVQVIKKVVV